MATVTKQHQQHPHNTNGYRSNGVTAKEQFVSANELQYNQQQQLGGGLRYNSFMQQQQYQQRVENVVRPYGASDYADEMFRDYATPNDEGKVKSGVDYRSGMGEMGHRHHNEVIKKLVRVSWSGTLRDFAKSETKRTCDVKFCDKDLDADDKLILYQTRLLEVQNTSPVGIGVVLKQTPTNRNIVSRSDSEFPIIVGPWTTPAQQLKRTIYKRSKYNGIDVEMLKGWDSHTKESLESTIITKKSGMWQVTNNSPIVKLVMANRDNWYVDDQTIVETIMGTVVCEEIAKTCFKWACRVIENLPFQDLSKISATIERADGRKFDSLEGIKDESPSSSYVVSNAMTELVHISATIEMTLVVWKAGGGTDALDATNGQNV